MNGKFKVAIASAAMVCFCVCPINGYSQSLQGSTAMSNASATVVEGSINVASGSGRLIVASVETTVEGTVVVLKGVSNGASATVHLSTQIVGGVSLATGTLVEASATGLGWVLKSGSEIIAFIPNEIGKSLLHHSVHNS